MKTKILFFSVVLFSVLQGQVPQTYTTFQGATLNLYKYEGANTMILANSNTLNSVAMNNWLNATDGAYNFYYSCTGQYPTCYANVTCFNGKSTIARVEATCGAGCGYIGFTGIELLNSYFDNTYSRILNDNQYDQAFFYEFGRNFWFYNNHLKYTSNDPIVTGYAVFMRFMTIENLGLNGAPFNGTLNFNTFREQVRNLRVTYLNDPTLNWGNTLGAGQGVPSSGLGATDLFASFCFYLKENYGGMNWVKNVWKKAGLRPTANTTQDAVDNFVIASSQAANANLVPLFQYWRWPISQSAMDYLNSLSLQTAEVKKNESNLLYPNPVTTTLNISPDLKITNLKIFDSVGRLIKNINKVNTPINVSDLHNGIYFVDLKLENGKNMKAKLIKE